MTITQHATRTYTTHNNGRAIVSHTIITRTISEIAIWRHGRRNPTFQGTVIQRHTGWCATDAHGCDRGTHTNYADAETALLRVRTGVRSTQQWDGPRPAGPAKPTCRVCGWELDRDGTCTRPDLHWTAASLAAAR